MSCPAPQPATDSPPLVDVTTDLSGEGSMMASLGASGRAGGVVSFAARSQLGAHAATPRTGDLGLSAADGLVSMASFNPEWQVSSPSGTGGLQFAALSPASPHNPRSRQDSSDALAKNLEPEERKKKKLHFAGWSSDDTAPPADGPSTPVPSEAKGPRAKFADA